MSQIEEPQQPNLQEDHHSSNVSEQDQSAVSANSSEPTEPAHLSKSNGDGSAMKEKPDFELYHSKSIAIATLGGSILAGGFLLSQNFKKLGKANEARNTLVLSAVATVLILALAMFLPDNVPGILITVPQIFLMGHIAKQQQGEAVEKHIEQGGAIASGWKAFGISLLFLAAIVAVLMAILSSTGV